jgi:hypothetical protein
MNDFDKTMLRIMTVAWFALGCYIGGYNGRKLNPTNAHFEYVNKDNLPDLVFKTGEIYLQKKDGSFVSYDTVLKHGKVRLDSIYKAKQDSLKLNQQNELKGLEEKLK